jgi:hypothetical protein
LNIDRFIGLRWKFYQLQGKTQGNQNITQEICLSCFPFLIVKDGTKKLCLSFSVSPLNPIDVVCSDPYEDFPVTFFLFLLFYQVGFNIL